MADRVAQYSISFGGDDADLKGFLSGIKSQFAQTYASIEAQAKRLDLFGGLSDKIGPTHDALVKATNDVAALTAAVNAAKAAGSPTKELEAGLKKAQTELAATSREFDKQVASLSRLQAQLSKAGVDTKNLAGEQERLAVASARAAAAQTDAAARQVLGLKTVKDIQPQINQAQAAYNTLVASGVLSVKDQALAQQALNTRIADLKGQVTGAGAAAKGAAPSLVSMFQGPIAHAVGLGLSIAGVVNFIHDAIAASKEFTNNVAAIGTVTNLTKDQLGALGEGARRLARDLGIDVQAALKGLFDLIRSGVPPDNALAVLRISAEAAKASLTDVGTGVKAANLLLDSFGASVDDLPLLFDKIVAGAKNGGATLAEFAANGGPLLNVARALNIDFDTLLGTLTVMVDKGGDAGKAFSDLTKILAKLNTTDVRSKLRDLGIDSTNVADIFRQIGERGLSLEQVLGVELSSGGAKAAAALATLTNNSKELPDAIDKIGKAAGTTKRNIDALYDTPAEKSARFDAALQNTEITIGRVAGKSSTFAVGLTKVFNAFNALAESAEHGTTANTLYDNSLARAIGNLFGVSAATEKVRAASETAGKATGDLADKNDRLAASAANAKAQLSDFGARLLADIQAIQAASARDVGDATARADAQIAALDRSLKATNATATKTIEIQARLAGERLAIIVKSEQQITAAVDGAVVARTEALRKEGKTEQQIVAETAQIRLTALAPILAQYQAHYNALIQQEQGYAAKIQAISQERVSFAESIEKRIFDIRLQALSVFDQYVAKANEADRLISLAREAAAVGDLAAAKKYTDQAIELAGQLKKVTDENGNVVITNLQAQQQALGIIKKAADAYNGALDQQDTLAKQGFDATARGIADVVPKIQDLQAKYDALKADVAKGLDVRVQIDETTVRNAEATLRELTRDRTVNIKTVITRSGESTPASADTRPQEEYQPLYLPVPGLAHGGLVRRFAGGGAVFRRPTWDKVPGIGNADTEPALLNEGSFVMRKSAVARYGDELMGRIARGYAAGGTVLRPGDIAGRILGGTNPIASRILGGGSGSLIKGEQPTLLTGQASAPTLPTDLPAKIKKVLTYVAQVREKALSIDGFFYWQRWLDNLTKTVAAFQRSPTDESITAVLEAARIIGLNLGITKREPQGFDVDGKSFHRSFGESPTLNTGTGLGGVFDFYAKGGNVGDTVPAMLTPGEFVINEPVVKRIVGMFGGGFLDAVNQARISPGMLKNLMDVAPPARPRGYADGGYVGDTRPTSATLTPAARGGDTWNINAAPGAILNRENFYRFIVPLLQERDRRK